MAAIEQAGDAIVMTDAQRAIQCVNPAFERTFGYTSGEVVNYVAVQRDITELFNHEASAV